MKNRPTLYVLDANALLHRAWHALPPLTSPDGMVVNAVYGVLMVVMKLLTDKRPDAFVACWDTEAPTFRHDAYKEYKAGREEQPDELYAQLPLLKEGLSLLGIDSLSKDGFEADDLIGTLAVQAHEKDWEVVIVTSDRDALQLVRQGISVLAFKKGVSDTIVFDVEEVKRQYGLTPEQFLEYKAMRGDPSDNIPGIRGIGEKGATDLLQRFGTLKAIYQAAHDETATLSKSVREKLLAAENDIPDIMKLVTVVTDVPVKWTPSVRTAELEKKEELQAFLLKLGFKTLVGRIPSQGEGSTASDRTPAPYEGEGAGGEVQRKSVRSGKSPRIEKPTDALAFLSAVRTSGSLIIHVAHGAADSLFAQSVEGLVLSSDGQVATFPTSFLMKYPDVKAEISRLLSDDSIRKIAHDAKAEMVGLESLGLSCRSWDFDTMLAAYLLGAGERNHDLEGIAARYASVNLSIDASDSDRVQAIARLAPILRTALEADGLSSIMRRFELPLVPVLRDMERTGIMIDPFYLKGLSVEMQKEKAALEKKMMESVGSEFNPASPSQLAEVLFERLQLSTKGIKKGKTGYSTAAPELEKLRGLHPLIEMIESHRELSKLLSTYVDVLPGLADKSGRVHTTYNQAITATGRLSSSEPNLQNIPIRSELGRKIRRGFIAPPGFQLLSCDYSQIELRLVAALAKDERMLEAFRRGDDIHIVTAAAIWNVPKENVTKEQRQAAKAINFGIIYGQGPNGLAASAGITFAEAKQFISAYFDVYQGIKRYMDETKALARQLGYVETFFGRRRPLPEIQSMMHQVRAQAERMAINMPIQGTSADLTKLAMIEVAKLLPNLTEKGRMLLQVHDEIVFEVPTEEVEKVAKAMIHVMENVEKVGVPLKVDAKVGRNWEEMERLKV